MGRGWIKLHRELQKHWLWEGTKEFTKAQAWIDLLLQVNHKSKKVMMDNELVKCNSGETITSETKLADRWGWSRTKVRSFIELLESDDMIKKQTKNKRYTKLSICNYSAYQKKEATKKQQKNNEKTTEKQQKNINKNVNNDKNDNKKPYTDDFEKFWELYDLKKGKKKAWIEWKKLSEDDKQTIFENVPIFLTHFSSKQYTPRPRKYLYNRYWEDEDYQKPQQESNHKTNGQQSESRTDRFIRRGNELYQDLPE